MNSDTDSPRHSAYERYASFQFTDDKTVVFDRENPEAWVSSTTTEDVRP